MTTSSDIQAPYADAWKDYRRRRFVMWAMFLGYMPGVVILNRIDTQVLRNLVPPVSIAFAWMVVFLGAVIWYGMWKCPRCHKHFMSAGLVGNAWARRCMNCRLPRWALSDPGPYAVFDRRR